MDETHSPEFSGAAALAVAIPPFAFCAVVASAAPRFTTWAALGSVAVVLAGFLLARRGRIGSPTRAFGVSLAGVAVMFAIYVGLVLTTLAKPIH
jgi:hypothetical protein